MKTNLNHLPADKKNELIQIAQLIQQNCQDVEMVILFGSYARGDYKLESDLKPDRKSGHVSDYDILVVTHLKDTAENIELWDTINRQCNSLNLSAQARLIIHPIQELNLQLEQEQYFFCDIKKEGIVLFNADNFELSEQDELAIKEQLAIAQQHFDYWYKTALMSFDDFKTDFEKGKNDKDYYRKAIFNLHQTVESCYKTVLLVYTNYAPKEHWLAALRDDVVDYEPAFELIFNNQSEAEKNYFYLLDYAYIGARYDPEYQVTQDNLEELQQPIEKLLKMTEQYCTQKIKNLV